MKSESGSIRIDGDLPQLTKADKERMLAGNRADDLISYNQTGLNVVLPVGPKGGLAAWPFKRLDRLWWACGWFQVLCMMILLPIGFAFVAKGEAFGWWFTLALPAFLASYTFQQNVLVPAMFPPEHPERA